MSNEYFKLLLSEKWTPKKTHKGKPWTGPLQYEDPSGELLMLPADMALLDPSTFARLPALMHAYPMLRCLLGWVKRP